MAFPSFHQPNHNNGIGIGLNVHFNFNPANDYPYLYQHALFADQLDLMVMMQRARNQEVAQMIWRDNLRAYRENVNIGNIGNVNVMGGDGMDGGVGFGGTGAAGLRTYAGGRVFGGLGGRRQFIENPTGVIYPIRNVDGLYPPDFQGAMNLQDLEGLGVDRLERILGHYQLPVERNVLQEALLVGQRRIERQMTQQEVLIRAVLEAVGARGAFDRTIGLGYDGGRLYDVGRGLGLGLDDDVDQAAERAIDQSLGRILRDRGNERNWRLGRLC